MENDAVALGQERRPARRVVAHGRAPMHAGGRAGASRDAQARLVRARHESELGASLDHRRGAARVEAGDEEGPPGREPHPARAESPRALDQRRELARLDFAERRRGADDDRRAEGMRPEHVAAATRGVAIAGDGFVSQPASANTGLAPLCSTSARIRRGASSPAPARAEESSPSLAAASPASAGAHSAASASSPAR